MQLKDDEFINRFCTPEKSYAARFWAVTIAVILFLSFGVWVAHAEDCPDGNQEARITDAISPADHVWIFEGEGLKGFFDGLRKTGLFSGTPSNVTKVYVTQFQHIYHIFFLNKGCIVDVRDAYKEVMEKILP